MAEFALEVAIAAWRRSMQNEGLRREQLAELEDHLRCQIERSIDAGHSPADSYTAACARLGMPQQVAGEFHKETNMHPLSKLLGLAIAIAAMLTVIEIEGGHSILLFQLPPLLMVVGVAFGGLVASHGPQRVWRMLAVSLGGGRPAPGEAAELQWVCRRGHRLAYAAGVLQAVFGVMQICSVLDQPSLIGPGIAYCLVGLVHAVLVAELGFATMERWVVASVPDCTPATPAA
ncbi:MAG: permease prefix domain 1-containing protein [Planctomycetota bacterium]|nr:permease prefix domain 1-containing protein [Planctomycetota bacterium]